MATQLTLIPTGIYYECMNTECFYHEHLMDHEEVVWKYEWFSEVQDLLLSPFCPSCMGRLHKEHYDGSYETETYV